MKMPNTTPQNMQALQYLQVMAKNPKYTPMVNKYLESILQTSLRTSGLGDVVDIGAMAHADGRPSGQNRELYSQSLRQLLELAQTATERALELEERLDKALRTPAETPDAQGRQLRSVAQFVLKLKRATQGYLMESCEPREETPNRMTFLQLWNEASDVDCDRWKEHIDLYNELLHYLTRDVTKMGLLHHVSDLVPGE